MKINRFSVMSPSTLSFDQALCAPVCVFRGRHASLALDLLRELMGDPSLSGDPDGYDDGRFVLHADVEMDGKPYNVCYIRNADTMGDNRIAVNFLPCSMEFSRDDTGEFLEKCNHLDKKDLPIFLYDFLDRMDEGVDTEPLFADLASVGRQVFIAVCPGYPTEKLNCPLVQVIETEEAHAESL